MAIVSGDATIGEIVRAERSVTLGDWIGIGLVEARYAQSGIDRYLARDDGDVPIRTVSAPFVDNLSLYVNPQQHRYRDRAAIAFPGPDRRP
jgi:glycine cleavage system aminomethyltransferase T